MNQQEESKINTKALSKIRVHIRNFLDELTAEQIIDTINTLSRGTYISTQDVINVAQMLLTSNVFTGDETYEVPLGRALGIETLNGFLYETNVRISPTENFLEVLEINRSIPA